MSRAAAGIAGLRIVLAVFGGYAAAAGLVALLAIVLVRVGMVRSEAVALGAMLGFPVYLVILIWSFAARRITVVASVLAIAAMAGGLAWAIRS